MNSMHAGFYEYLALNAFLFVIVFLVYVFFADENDMIEFTIPMPDFIARRFK
jgi:hypothetical protein